MLLALEFGKDNAAVGLCSEISNNAISNQTKIRVYM